ncbi:MAG TPA: SDR family oxidoreductase [Hyphomonadaceae bacterium]|nr:SDR family oxidoreductase [Hyphomonadaceae bacterium]
MLPKQLFVFGFGYVASRLALTLAPKGVATIGTTRTEASAADLKTRGLNAVVWPGADITPPAGAAWLISVPPDDNGCPVFRSFGTTAKTASWIGYLSTTGVYGDLGGGWAFEETPLNPQSREAINRARAEAEWRSAGASIFRLPGIYGPGRSQLERVREPGARRIVKEGQVFSRIHVADLADLLALSIEQGGAPDIYNVCDDEPAPADQVLVYAAELLGLPPPPAVAFEDANLSPAAQRFYAECKRVSNAKAKGVFGWAPQHPNFREGLADCLKRERELPKS